MNYVYLTFIAWKFTVKIILLFYFQVCECDNNKKKPKGRFAKLSLLTL